MRDYGGAGRQAENIDRPSYQFLVVITANDKHSVTTLPKVAAMPRSFSQTRNSSPHPAFGSSQANAAQPLPVYVALTPFLLKVFSSFPCFGATMRMTPLRCVSSLVLLAIGVPAIAQEEDWSKIQLKVTKVAETVYMIDKVEDGTDSFAGGNIGVSIGSDGIVLVDVMFAPLAPKIFAALKTLSDKPVTFVIITHVHSDHTDGNAVFGATSTIIAHANTRQELSTRSPELQRERLVPAVALPIITVDDSLTLHQNGEDIRLFHFPNAHSNTDLVVYFKQSNVVHMGDMYFSGMFPFIGSGGSAKGLIAGIEKVLSETPANAKIIPGHGPLSNMDELRSTLTMLKETSAIVENGIKQKKSLEQMTKEKVLAKYDNWAGGYINTDQYLQQQYEVLTR